MLKSNSGISVTNAIELYLKSREIELKHSTFAIYQGYIKRYIEPYFKDILCEQLTQDVVQNFVAKMIENGLAVRTVKSIFLFFRLGIAEKTGIIFKVKFPKSSKKEVGFLTSAEQKSLEISAQLSGMQNYVAIMLCLYLGIRLGECCGLKWTDFDFTRNTLSINRTLQRIQYIEGDTKTKLVFQTPKSTSSLRVIPIPSFLLPLLLEFQKTAESEYVISRVGTYIDPRTLQKRFKKICENAKIKSLSWHSMRHSFCVRLMENKENIKVISDLLGHSSSSITLKYYAHCVDEQKRTCIESLNCVFYDD
ncbi:site-specific integrase [Clostridia bacterium]|nr:site-specific integrase [Clostridia bacterium]